MQYSHRKSELYLECADPAQTGTETGVTSEHTLLGWPVREGRLGPTRHHTLTAGDVASLGAEPCRRLTHAMAALLGTYLQDAGQVLVVGLGNGALTADRLGTAVCSRLTLGGIPLGSRTLYSLVPGVSAVTGIPTDKLVARTATLLHADRILAVDALCACGAASLGKVVQFSDVGLTPGSGTTEPTVDAPLSSDYPPEISTRTMPCPVVTVGVPTVIRTTLPDGGNDRYLVTAGDTDRTVERWGSLLSSAILQAAVTPDRSQTSCTVHGK